jgi:hypothetical protein
MFKLKIFVILSGLFLSVFSSSFSSGPPFCGTVANGGLPPMQNTYCSFSCDDAGDVIDTIIFASYGTPSGSCPNFQTGSCNAANSTSVVEELCVGKQTCVVFPNTTTFSDPCFGTAKIFDAVLTCAKGPGSSTCGVPPAPAENNFTTIVSIQDWSDITAINKVSPSIQVVTQHYLYRDSPIYDQSFKTLAMLGATNVRFVPWLTYASYGVGQLMPPTSPHLCGIQNWQGGQNNRPITLDCGFYGGVFTSIDFASFGQPTGNCGSYSTSSTCHAANSTQVVESICLGKSSCILPTAAGDLFGTPCTSNALWLAVQATCSNKSAIHTYWNLTLPDQLFTDFWNAVDGDISEPIPNFSTQPTWLYSPTDYNWQGNPDQPADYTRGAAENCNTTLLGDYYGRLYGYFINGYFIDESGATITRPSGAAKIKQIEVFNEVDYEHGYTPQTYTKAFDAVVKGVRKYADPKETIHFVGLSLPNIDNGQTIVSWAEYFLNISNHDIEVTKIDAIGYHAYPTNGPYSSDPSSFENMFKYVDTFVNEVLAVDQVIANQSPNTRTYLDETGTDMDGVLGVGSPPDNNPRYWVAAASYWAYMYARCANESSSVAVVGASQFMDAPGQEPSVTLVDWSSGLGTARFWIVKLFVENFSLGDSFIQTSSISSGNGTSFNDVFAMGYISASSGNEKRILLINKRNAYTTISLTCQGGTACSCSGYKVIDESNRLNPARDESACSNGVLQLAPFATAIVFL